MMPLSFNTRKGDPPDAAFEGRGHIMAINLTAPDIRELKPHITVFGVGGAGGNAVNNMIEAGLQGVDFVVANTDAQALTLSKATRIIQMGLEVTEGLGAGSQPEIGRAAAEEVIDEIRDQLAGAHMVFITAGMGGGTGTGAGPVVARIARDMGILTVGVVTKPFQFEGVRRMKVAEAGIQELQQAVDTLIVIPNQNLFRVANEKTTFADAFAMADQVLYSGVACITDLMVKEGLINLDFADVRAIMRGMGKAMMGTGEATGEKRAILAAEAAIANPLLDDVSMKGARGLLISITGGNDLTLYEVDEAATRIREEVDHDANIILGATFDGSLDGVIRVSVVATGIEPIVESRGEISATEQRIAEVAERLRAEARARVSSVRGSIAAPAADTSYEQASPGVVPAQAPVETQRPVPVQPSALYPDVTIAPSQPKANIGVEARVLSEHAETPESFQPRPAAFLPPAAERATIRPTRMPEIADLPLPVQEQIRASRAEPSVAVPVQTKPMTLLQRLAAVGLGRRDDTHEQASTQQVTAPTPAPQSAAPAYAREPQPSAVHAEYGRRQAPAAPRPAQGNLDAHGRAPTQARTIDDDQLEIPAFLRRHSN
jgi:cell division protein FtsZ